MTSLPVSANDITPFLPNLPAATVDALVARLLEVGAETTDLLQHVIVQDLVPLLKPLQARKLISDWCQSRVPLTPRSEVSNRIPTPSTRSAAEGHSTPVSTPVSATTSRSLSDFHVQWNKMPPELLKSMSDKERPSPSIRREMVRIICSDIHTMCPQPGRRQLRGLAEKIVAEYPSSFQDMVGEDVVGSGHDSLLLQLESRLDNINRGRHPVKRRLHVMNTDTDSSGAVSKTKKTCPRDYYGCISWQPPLPTGDEFSSLKEKQSALKALSLEVNPDMKVVAILMEETYCLQRHDINDGMDATDLKASWPFLFSPIGIDVHCKQLTGVSLLEAMTASFNSKTAPMLSYFKTSSKRCSPVLSRIEVAKAALKNDSPSVIGLLLLLAAHFNDKEDGLVLTKDVGTSVPAGLCDCPATPRLIVLGDSTLTGSRLLLSVHGIVVCDNISNPVTAVAMLFGTYYVMNLHYPEGAAITLEFIQRSFAGINPQRGTKAERRQGKKIHTTHPKILSLTNALRDFTNQWAL